MGALAGWLFTRYPAIYGLDVKGGVRITYQIDDSKLTPEQRTRKAEYKENILSTLKNRASSSLGVAEPRVIAKGEDQYVVELPGATNADEAKRVLGTSASIKFYHARNVATEKASYRNYKEASTETLPGSDHSVVEFDYLGKKIKPQDPEYDRMIQGWDLLAQGTDLAKAQAEPSGVTGNYSPEMNFTGKGADQIEQWSRRYQNEGEKLAAVLDGEVLSIAPLKTGAILSGGNVIIEGTFDKNYVVKLVNLLNSGSLPVDLKVLSSENVDPTIGDFAYHQMVVAGAIAFGVIALFLIGYYAFPGFIALLALLLYMLFTLTALKFMGATFSLASIAGFVLSVGMAVDANILVFERFKEEMKSGKSLVAGMDLGFRRAFPAIVDSNMCTIITSIVLATLGTGPVKGFATTLIIGVGISLFTAVSVTRSLLFFAVGSGVANNTKWYGLTHEWFGKRFEEGSAPLRVVENSRKWFILSAITILIGVPFAFMGGFKLNVEFRGGTEIQYRLKDVNQNAGTLSKNLEAAGFRSPNVQFGTAGQSGKLAYITLEDSPLLHSAADPKADLTDQEIQTLVAQKSGIDGEFVSLSKVGPAIQGETIQNAVIGVVLSSLLIVIYLGFRFGLSVGGFGPGLRFALSAIGALVHDIFVVFFLAAVVGFFMHWEISALFITAMLTIIGFSVHDTIVIFDRIRENLRKSAAGVDFGDLMDRSITQSFARSINTSMTVIVTLLILVLFGTATVELKFFCVAMLVGIISGTYSSIYNASPILYLIDKAIGAKKGPQATLVGLAHAENARTRIVAPHAAVATPGTTASPTPGQPATGRTYGQVKRRANQAKDSVRNYDDEP